MSSVPRGVPGPVGGDSPGSEQEAAGPAEGGGSGDASDDDALASLYEEEWTPLEFTPALAEAEPPAGEGPGGEGISFDNFEKANHVLGFGLYAFSLFKEELSPFSAWSSGTGTLVDFVQLSRDFGNEESWYDFIGSVCGLVPVYGGLLSLCFDLHKDDFMAANRFEKDDPEGYYNSIIGPQFFYYEDYYRNY